MSRLCCGCWAVWVVNPLELPAICRPCFDAMKPIQRATLIEQYRSRLATEAASKGISDLVEDLRRVVEMATDAIEREDRGDGDDQDWWRHLHRN